MENQQKSTPKIALNYGLILGVLSVLIHVILFAMGKHLEQDWKISLISILVTTILIVAGIKKFKATNNGLLSIGQGLKTGISIALISAIIYIAYTMLFMHVIAPESMGQALEIASQKMIDENPNLSDEQIETAISMQEKFSSPTFLVPIMLVVSLFIGFVISMIASAILRKSEDLY